MQWQPEPGGTSAVLPEALAQAGVPPHHGDPFAEYRAVRDAAGIADRRDLAHVVLFGRDPVRMMQGLMTNDLVAAPEDRAVYGALLTPKGRTIAELRALKVVSEQGTEVWADLPREILQDATNHLRRSIPPLYAKWRDASDEIGILGVYGPRSRELLSLVFDDPLPELGEDAVVRRTAAGAAVRVIGTRYAGGEEGFDLLAGSEALARIGELLLERGGEWGVRRVGFAALEALRIEAGRPRGGRELTEETIPTEAFEATGLMERAISFGKGCYTGQEVIVRIAHRGHVNRHLRGLLLPESGPVAEPGTRLFHPESGKDVGWITSSAESPLMGAPIALGFVRREIEPGAAVRLGDAQGPEVLVMSLPFRKEERS